jgi:hypothetical protein
MTAPDIPSSTESTKEHTNSDVDAAQTSQHHTLGISQNQAAAGSHTHDGKNSKRLGKGKNLTFPTTAAAAYSQAQMQSVIDALRGLGYGS